MLSNPFLQYLSQKLVEHDLATSPIMRQESVSGGSINETYGIFTRHEAFFIKVNDLSKYPLMFELEQKGLSTLIEHSNFHIPKVFLLGEFEEQAFLIMEYITSAHQKSNYWNDFGQKLAELHQQQADKFGLAYDNYIGSLHQANQQSDNWVDFFIHQRLEHQARLAFDQGRIDPNFIKQLDSLYPKLKSIFPLEKPCLLHGDLWSGNFMVNQNGEAALVDPAIYYGHREMDIAMTHLFGGFQAEFYRAYQDHFPLENDWEERIDLCNLYPLLVHVNLFGSSYARRVKSVLSRFA